MGLPLAARVRTLPPNAMGHDILSDVLRTVRLRGALFYQVNGGRTWAAEAPPAREIASAVMPGADHVMEYHVVTRGHCWAAIVGQPPVRLETGDVVVFAHGDAHVISSAPELPEVVSSSSLPERLGQQLPFTLHLDAAEARDGTCPSREATTALMCGFLGCDLRPFNPLIATLPRLLHLRHSASQQWIAHFIGEAIEESQQKRPGGEAMLERLSEMMFVDAVRRHVEGLPADSLGWLAGVRDRFVGPALALLHAAPAESWTVEELGQRVGLSRSALHERFATMVGQAPMQYLASWRMQIAAGLLRSSNKPIASIAQQVGYETEAAFTKAFKRLVGTTPGAWRKGTVAAPLAIT